MSMLSAVMLNVIMPSVVAPQILYEVNESKFQFEHLSGFFKKRTVFIQVKPDRLPDGDLWTT
jgi:hypothetical protein